MMAGEETAVKFYEDHVREVRQTVPPQQLLVFQVKEGWKPLCQFLGVPVPSKPFPNVNDTRDMMLRAREMKRLCYFCWGLAAVALGVFLLTVALLFYFS